MCSTCWIRCALNSASSRRKQGLFCTADFTYNETADDNHRHYLVGITFLQSSFKSSFVSISCGKPNPLAGPSLTRMTSLRLHVRLFLSPRHGCTSPCSVNYNLPLFSGAAGRPSTVVIVIHHCSQPRQLPLHLGYYSLHQRLSSLLGAHWHSAALRLTDSTCRPS